jgi:transcriptional regulator with XRE-family HTH domain
MPSEPLDSSNVVGRRMRSRREELGWSQEKVGVLIGIDESSARARISRYELGLHEAPLQTARKIANALGAPLEYLYCEDDNLAALLLSLAKLKPSARKQVVSRWFAELA